jgi:hypothetical protein
VPRVLRRIAPARWLSGERPIVIAGTCALLLAAWVCMYGKLWCFEAFDAHRFTARAMLTGTLRLRSVVAMAGHDEQVHDGAVYTNWGFGVPVLQLPFHALAGALGWLHGFFPDRAIYFVYLAAAIPVIWAALDRLLAMRAGGDVSPARRRLVSWAATWLVLNLTLFPFMETRFVVFEETIAYMTICELLALSAYVFALGSWRPLPVCAMGIASGVGLLVRPTGLLYAGVWGSLVALERRPGRVKRTLLFAAAAAPFVAFWLYTNWARSGSVLGLGYDNSNPAWEYEMPILRFGSTCADSPGHVLQAAGRLFGAFFLYIWRRPDSDWLRACHFDMEERDGTREPYFGPAVLVLLVGLVWRLLARRERRIALLVPYAGMALLFVAFVRRGEGFAWRYVGDFWPLVVLACVQYVHTQPREALAPFDSRLAKIMFWVGFVALARFLVPWEWSSGGPNGRGRADIVLPRDTGAMWEAFRASRWGHDEPAPSKISCGDRLGTPYQNGLGWRDECKVASFTNVYLGVRPKDGDRYTVRFTTQGIEAEGVRVYVNGTVVPARRSGNGYEADVVLHREAMGSPIVVATVEWTRTSEAPTGKLLSVELV